MSAVERLAAAMFDGFDVDDASAGPRLMVTVDILNADPDLAQDIEDGRAIRELRAALPDGWYGPDVTTSRTTGLFTVQAFTGRGKGTVIRKTGATIAAAADACRAALEDRS